VEEAAEVEEQDIAALMGFGGFGTTQVKPFLTFSCLVSHEKAEPPESDYRVKHTRVSCQAHRSRERGRTDSI